MKIATNGGNGGPWRRIRFKSVIAVSACLLGLPTASYAVEGGIYGAPLGGTDIRQALLPPPGIYGAAVSGTFSSPYFTNQFGGYSSNNPAYLNSEVVAGTIQVVYPWKPFDFTIASSFQVEYEYEAQSLTPGGIHKSGTEFGFGDSYADVFYASHYLGLFGATPGDKQLKYGLTGAFGLAVEVPLGAYNVNNFVNTGHNTLITIPNVALTYITGPNLSLGDATEISARFFFDTNKMNPADGYLSGNLIDLDYSFTQHLGSFQVGLAGDYAKQISADHSKTGVVQPAGDEFEKVDLGPVVAYDFPDHSVFKFKALFPVVHENNYDNKSFVLVYARQFWGF